MADVLIVDDDLDTANVLAEVMRAEGHEVRVGYNGSEGLQLARARLPDIALLDVEMPLLDGPGLAYQMFIHNMGLDEVPVIFLSGVTNLEEVAQAVGTPYFLGKPYRYSDIIALLAHALSERVAPHPARR